MTYGYRSQQGEYRDENFTATFVRTLFDAGDGQGDEVTDVELHGVTFLGFDIDINHLCSGQIDHIMGCADDARWGE